MEKSLGRHATVTREKDGTIHVRLLASDTSVVVRWALGLGRAAEILDPPAVRTAAREALAATASVHAAPTASARHAGQG